MSIDPTAPDGEQVPASPAPYAPPTGQPAYGQPPVYGEQPAPGQVPGYGQQPAPYGDPRFSQPAYGQAPYAQQPYGPAPYGQPAYGAGYAAESSKSFIATWLLAWFLGWLGIDRFYLGKVGTGILKLITIGGFGIWWFIDLILVLAGFTKDKQGLPLQGYEQNKKIAWIVTGVLVALSILSNAVTGGFSRYVTHSNAAPASVVVVTEGRASLV